MQASTRSTPLQWIFQGPRTRAGSALILLLRKQPAVVTGPTLQAKCELKKSGCYYQTPPVVGAAKPRFALHSLWVPPFVFLLAQGWLHAVKQPPALARAL